MTAGLFMLQTDGRVTGSVLLGLCLGLFPRYWVLFIDDCAISKVVGMVKADYEATAVAHQSLGAGFVAECASGRPWWGPYTPVLFAAGVEGAGLEDFTGSQHCLAFNSGRGGWFGWCLFWPFGGSWSKFTAGSGGRWGIHFI